MSNDTLSCHVSASKWLLFRIVFLPQEAPEVSPAGETGKKGLPNAPTGIDLPEHIAGLLDKYGYV